MILNVKENDKVMMVLPKGKDLDTVKPNLYLHDPMKKFLKRYMFKPLTVKYTDEVATQFKECSTGFCYDNNLFKKVVPIEKNNTNLKKGDRVIFRLPKGKKLKTYASDAFEGGLIDVMVKQIKENNGVFVVRDAKHGNTFLRLEDDGHSWVWDSRWFMKIVDKPLVDEEVVTFKFRSDRRTEAFVFDENGLAMNYGWALKDPDDKYNKEIGMIVAFARLLNIPNVKISAIVDILLNGAMTDITEAPYSEIFETLKERAEKEEKKCKCKAK